MDVHVEKLPKSRVKLTIALAEDEVRPYLDQVARELSKEHPVKGFRPGAVPLDVVRSTVGDQALIEHTLGKLVPKTYVETLLEHEEIEAIGRPEVTAQNVTVGESWTYEATVAVLPGVKLGDYRSVRGQLRESSVDPADVDRELQTLRRMRASFLTVPRAAQTGDRVNIDVRAGIDRVPLESGTATNEPVLIGESHLVPGFEDKLLGMKEGETKTFTLTFPETHHERHLRGRAVEFTVTVKDVQQRILPSLDDGFAKSLGKFESLADLRTQLQKNLREEKTEKERQRLQMDLLHQIITNTTFSEFPNLLVEGEIDKMLAELVEGLSGTGLTLEQYLQQVKKTTDEIRAGFREQAGERIRAGLTLRAVAKAERVQVSDEEVTEEVHRVLQRFPSVEEAKKRVNVEELTDVAAGTIRNRKVFALLEGFAGVGR